MGKPNHYHLSAAPPRLPSYDSIRKQDRQRQVHAMILRRFGLGGVHEEVSLQHIVFFHWFLWCTANNVGIWELSVLHFKRNVFELKNR